MFCASIFFNGSGAFRETGALRFLFIPKGALTHHLPAGQAVVTFPLVRPCARLRAKSLAMLGCAPTRLAAARRPRRDASCGSLQPMLPRLRSRSSLSARRNRCGVSSACKNLLPAALSQRQGRAGLPAPAFSFAKENQKKNRGGENDWRFIIWRRRSSAEERAAPHARPRPI